jgi:hypothetical protein
VANHWHESSEILPFSITAFVLRFYVKSKHDELAIAVRMHTHGCFWLRGSLSHKLLLVGGAESWRPLILSNMHRLTSTPQPSISDGLSPLSSVGTVGGMPPHRHYNKYDFF